MCNAAKKKSIELVQSNGKEAVQNSGKELVVHCNAAKAVERRQVTVQMQSAIAIRRSAKEASANKESAVQASAKEVVQKQVVQIR